MMRWISGLLVTLWATSVHAQTAPDIALVERAWTQLGFLGLLLCFIGFVLWKVYAWGLSQQQRADKMTDTYQEKSVVRYEAAITTISLMTAAMNKITDKQQEFEATAARMEANQNAIKTNLVNIYALLTNAPAPPVVG